MTIADHPASSSILAFDGFAPEALDPLLAAARRRIAAGDAAPLVTVTSRAPALDPIALFAAARELDLEAALWLQPAAGLALIGIGRTWAIEPSGADRFTAAGDAWRSVLATALSDGADTALRGAGPVLLGGLGFTGRVPAADGQWAPFGASSLVLPEFALAQTHDEVRLTAAIGPGTIPTTDVEAMERRWRALVARALELAAGPDDEGIPLHDGTLSVIGEQPGRAAWDRLVGLYAGAVGRGRLDKVVLARRVDVRSRDGLDVPAALHRLAASAPESTTFAFSRGRGTFLGATPERLVRTAGHAFETVAIAGSAPRSADAAEDARLGAGLVASEKDREEHAVVVTMLRTSLSPLVDELRVAPSPALIKLRHVQHLVTPMAGTLRDDAGLLALAERLHPTPAVGGEPRALALEMIAEHEGFERGWYAGPIGWVGADGDGELMVALRCGLVEERDAALFAGCGIVADSDPASEWEESRIKLRAVGSALGDVVETVAQGVR
jgi:isochorismate synthase